MSEHAFLDRLRRRLADDPRPPSAARVAEVLRAEGLLESGRPGLMELQAIEDELLGAGPLAPLLRDDDVTDVLVNAPDDVWVDRGRGLERADVTFADDEDVRRLVRRLLAPTGRRLDAAQPWVDARLPDGTRLHAVLPPIATRATCVSLRTLRRQQLSLAQLVDLGSLPGDAVPWIEALVRARVSVVITGGTGTGKTTLLSTLLGLIDPNERVVVVEDAAELRPTCAHVVSLEARPANVEGAGTVSLRDLVRQALRMRPDRLVVGEVRGVEVVDMLAALNTGHEGGLTTVHANSAVDLVPRLEALAAGAASREALHAAVGAALDVVMHLVRERSGLRRLAAVGVVSVDRGEAAAVTALDVRPSGVVPGPATADLAALLASRGCAAPA